MDAKNNDGRASIKPIKIEKGTDKFSRDLCWIQHGCLPSG